MLHRIVAPVFVVALCTALAGQTKVTSPSGLGLVEGQTFSSHFGGYANARYVLFDGELRNSSIGLKEVAYRDDYYPHTQRSGMGRSWTDVKIDMALCDMKNISPIFVNNMKSTPTRVFSGSVTWPTLSSHPTTLPAKFLKVFPFSTTWNYSGTMDLCIDHDFNGGVMANNASWSTDTRYDYYLDAYPTNSFAEGVQVFHGDGGPSGGCKDGTSPVGALNFLHVNGYNSNYHVPAYRDKYQLYTMSYYTGQNQPVANIVNFKGSAAGITFPSVFCNKLHIDVSKFLLISVTSANGPGAWSGYIYPTKTAEGLLPYSSSYVNLDMWAQAYWSDSKDGQIRLSRAVNVKIPWVPRPVKRAALFQPFGFRKNSTGYGPFTGDTYNPVIQYSN